MRTKIFCVFVLIVIILTGCAQSHKNLVENDFLSIRAGMTTSQIKQKLGKPDTIYTEHKKIEKLRENDSENSTDAWVEANPKLYKKFYGSEKNAIRLLKKIHSDKNVICYEYSFKYIKEDKNKYKWRIYFLNDKVIGMYFP